MSIRKRLVLSYIGMFVIPLVLFGITLILLYSALGGGFRGEKGSSGAPWAARGLTSASDELFAGVAMMAQYDAARLEDRSFIGELDGRMADSGAGLVVLKRQEPLYVSPMLQEAVSPAGLVPLLATYEGGAPAREHGAPWLRWDGIKLDGHRYMVDSRTFVFPDGSEGSVYRLTDTSAATQFFHRFGPWVPLILLVVLALTNGVLTYVVSRSIIKPLDALKRAAEHIKEGNLDHELQLRRKDEIGELGEAFEEMRKRLRESIHMQLQYEENRKELLSNISHDLKTPIMAIKGCIEGIRDGVADTPDKRERYMGMIASKADEMDRQIEELFLFSKLDLKRLPFHYEQVDIAAYLRDYVDEVQLVAQRQGVQVAFDDGGDPSVFVVADREKLHRVVTNIVDNSLKYMQREGGSIRIELREGEAEVNVAVRDDGPGIGSEALPHIFDRFYRAEQSRNTGTGGSGLGLAIVRQIVEEHGGRVWAESEAGAGTAIFFTLPKRSGSSEGERA